MTERPTNERIEKIRRFASDFPSHGHEQELLAEIDALRAEISEMIGIIDTAEGHLNCEAMGIKLAAQYLRAVREGADDPSRQAYGHEWVRQFFDGRAKR